MPLPLSSELRALQQEIEGHARSFGLDFFETIYEVLDWEEINEVAAFGGYPARYPACTGARFHEPWKAMNAPPR